MNIRDILNQLGYQNLIDSGEYYRTKPLYRESDNSIVLSIHKNTGKWFDFARNLGGDLDKFIKLHQENFVVDKIDEQEKTYIEEEKKFNKDLLLKLNKNHEYWQNRGIDSSVVEEYLGGVAINGKLKNRYVFPIFNLKNDLVGFSGRALNNFNLPKWKLIGFKKKWCYPFYLHKKNILENNSVILVESIGDMLALRQANIRNTLVTFGVFISPEIVIELLKYNINKIIIAFNNDSMNNFVGNNAAQKEYYNLKKYFDESQIKIHLPYNKKDFGEMTIEEIKIWKNSL